MIIHAQSSPTLFMFLLAMSLQRAATDSMLRCEVDKLSSCMVKLIQNPRMRLMEGINKLDLINSCNEVDDVLACLNEAIVDGCPEDVKRTLPAVPAYFGFVRDNLCGKDARAGLIEFNKCREAHIMETCLTAAHHHEKQGSLGETTFLEALQDAKCRALKTEFDCLLEAAVGCPPAAQPGIEAWKKYASDLLAKERCPSLGDGGNAGSISAPWSPVILGALCATLLFPLLYQASMLQA